MHPTPHNPPHDERRAARHAARQLERRTRGRWVCWYGTVTGHFWAMPCRGHLVLAEGESIGQLVQRMTEVDAFTGRQLNGAWRSP